MSDPIGIQSSNLLKCNHVGCHLRSDIKLVVWIDILFIVESESILMLKIKLKINKNKYRLCFYSWRELNKCHPVCWRRALNINSVVSSARSEWPINVFWCHMNDFVLTDIDWTRTSLIFLLWIELINNWTIWESNICVTLKIENQSGGALSVMVIVVVNASVNIFQNLDQAVCISLWKNMNPSLSRQFWVNSRAKWNHKLW